MGSYVKARISNVFIRIARTLVRVDELAAAALAARLAARICRDNTEAYVIQSAIARAIGDPVAARKIIDHGISINPCIIAPCKGRQIGTLLKVRGIDQGYFTLGKDGDGDRVIKIRGGNTSDRYLTDRSKFSTVNFLVHDGNLCEVRNLPAFDVILNMISDPDVERTSLNTLAAFLRTHNHFPVINRPERVIETTRDENYRRFHGLDGVVFPITIRLPADGVDRSAVETAMAAAGIEFPCLIRATGTHTGRSVARIETGDELGSYLGRSKASELYVTAYVENRFRGNLFRKLRVFQIDGEIYPVVCHIDGHWNVHGGNRRQVMGVTPWMVDEERAFIADPAGYLGDGPHRVVRDLLERTGLDFCGIDFTVLDDGGVLVFEINPAMRHAFDHARHFPYLTEPLSAVTAAFNQMIIRKVATIGAGSPPT